MRRIGRPVRRVLERVGDPEEQVRDHDLPARRARGGRGSRARTCGSSSRGGLRGVGRLRGHRARNLSRKNARGARRPARRRPRRSRARAAIVEGWASAERTTAAAPKPAVLSDAVAPGNPAALRRRVSLTTRATRKGMPRSERPRAPRRRTPCPPRPSPGPPSDAASERLLGAAGDGPITVTRVAGLAAALDTARSSMRASGAGASPAPSRIGDRRRARARSEAAARGLRQRRRRRGAAGGRHSQSAAAAGEPAAATVAGRARRRRRVRRARADGAISRLRRRRATRAARGSERAPRAAPSGWRRDPPSRPRTYPFSRNHATARASASSTGRLRKTELAHRLARVEVHPVAGHPHASSGTRGVRPVDAGPARRRRGGRERDPVRQPDPRRRKPRQTRQRLEDLLQRHVPVSEDVLLPDASPLRGEQCPSATSRTSTRFRPVST